MAMTAVEKTTTYRLRMRDQGLRLVQMWMPDTRTESYAKRLQKQCMALKGDPEEEDALAFTMTAADLTLGWAG